MAETIVVAGCKAWIGLFLVEPHRVPPKILKQTPYALLPCKFNLKPKKKPPCVDFGNPLFVFHVHLGGGRGGGGRGGGGAFSSCHAKPKALGESIIVGKPRKVAGVAGQKSSKSVVFRMESLPYTK